MKRHWIFRALLIGAVISGLFFVCLSPGYAAKKPLVMKIGNPGPGHPHKHFIAASSLEIKDYVERHTNGGISVEIYPANQLGTMRAIVNATKLGTIQGATCYSAVATMFLPEVELIYIPFVFSSPEVTWRVFDGWFGRKLENLWIERTGLLPLYQADNGGMRAFGMRKRQIYKPADLKGLKIRTPQSESIRIFVESLGAAPAMIDWTELYSAAETGVVDGFEVPTAVLMFKLYEVIEYASITGHTWDMTFLLINRKWFKGLPEHYRKVVIEAGRHAKTVNRGMSELLAAEIVQELKKRKVEVYTADAAVQDEFRKITQKPVEDYIRKKIGDQWVDDFYKAVKEAEAAAKADTGRAYQMFMK
jgi:tripartite ATP-independent transporter DctP family solute receptor